MSKEFLPGGGMYTQLVASFPAKSLDAGSLVLRFANTVTYFQDHDSGNCSLHSVREHGRGQH